MKKTSMTLLALAFLINNTAQANSLKVYAKNDTLFPVVYLFEQRKFEDALSLIDSITGKDPKNIDAHRMGMIVGTSKDDFIAILYHAEAILKQVPNDAQAWYMKGIYSKGIGLNGYDEALKKMLTYHSPIGKRMKDIVTSVDALWNKPIHKATPSICDEGLGILALGSPANPNGTPQPRLLNTLTKTLALAKDFPHAPIFVTGGAVYTSMTESEAMKNYLIKQGISADRIIMEDKARDTVGNALNIIPYLKKQQLNRLLLVTVDYHLRRASLIIDGVFEKQGIDIELIGIAGESDKIGFDYAKQMVIERAASYRDRGRIEGLFEQEDFLTLR